MIDLRELKDFCNNKKIIIVGNSSRILSHTYGTLIDNYEIVVRINRGYQPGNTAQQETNFRKQLGSKTTILSLGVKSSIFARQIVSGNACSYILCPIIWSDKLDYPNVHDIDPAEYHKLKEELGGFKPSTGISTYNFFNKLNNFKRLDLIGFDFFESSTPHRNQLGHLRVTDHHGRKEKLFFETSRDLERTLIHETKPGGIPINNIPTMYNSKSYRRR